MSAKSQVSKTRAKALAFRLSQGSTIHLREPFHTTIKSYNSYSGKYEFKRVGGKFTFCGQEVTYMEPVGISSSKICKKCHNLFFKMIQSYGIDTGKMEPYREKYERLASDTDALMSLLDIR